MRVLHVGKYYPPYSGGIETVVRYLAEGLVSSGVETTVLCSNTTSKDLSEEMNGVQVLRLGTYGELASQPMTLSFLRKIREMSEDYDIVHYHSPNPLAELSSLLSKGKKVVTYHSDIVRQKILGKAYQPLLRKFLSSMDAIVVGSEQAIEFSPHLPLFRKNCHVIPMGIDDSSLIKTEAVEKKVSEIKEKHGEFILFTGRLVSYKGLDVLIDAMKEVDTKLLIVGRGPLHEELEAQIQSLGLENKIQLLGRIDDNDEFAAYFHACEIFVLPSTTRAEAFGMVMVEAMSCGKPVVSTKLPSGVRFVNEDGVSGFQVEPGNSAELAEAINKILINPDLKRKMGQSSRQRFESLFQMDQMVDNYKSLYKKILSR